MLTLNAQEVSRLVSWAREVFTRTELDWSVADDDLLDRLYQYQRAISPSSTEGTPRCPSRTH